MAEFPWRSIRMASQGILRVRGDLSVEGLGHVPADGPVIVAARHYHHLYDGCALLTAISRPAHIMVGLDWVGSRVGLTAMTAACRSAEWPIVSRAGANPRLDGHKRADLRRSLADSLKVLRRGHVLIVFPEGYPTIDPRPTPKSGPDEFLPFRAGFARIAIAAAAEGLHVPIVPAGFAYRKTTRWQVSLRFGEPLLLTSPGDQGRVVQELEHRVRELSVGQ
jgi:putative membrane protein